MTSSQDPAKPEDDKTAQPAAPSAAQPAGGGAASQDTAARPVKIPRADQGTANIDELAKTAESHLGIDSSVVSPDASQRLSERVKTVLIGKPRDLTDTSIYHALSLVAFLAWVGLGADGLSSSAYGPAEAFVTLLHSDYGDLRYLAVFLALATAVTVFVISACYSHILEEFPTGGGGYLVASKLLGPRVGVVSGCALLVDYALTITTSIAAAGDALFGLLGTEWHFLGLTHHECKLLAEFAGIGLLIVLNLRGIKESVTVLMPIFLVFLVTHAILIFGTLALNIGAVGATTERIATQLGEGIKNPDLGILGMLMVFLHAYSLGAGTYTGIEAVSQQHARDARAACRDRQADDALHGRFAGGHGQRVDGRLPAARHPPAREPRRQDDEHPAQRGVRRRNRTARLGGRGVRDGDDRGRGRAVARGGPGRLHRRPARAGQHGPRLVGAALVCQPFRTAGGAQRRAGDGRGGPGGLVGYGRKRRRAAGDVRDQRVRHVFAVDDRHVPPLVGRARHATRCGSGGSPCSCSAP